MYKIITILAIAAVIGNCQDEKLAFAERPSRVDSENPPKRVALYAPDKCPGNQYLYPGDQESDWICDCAPGYIYYPPKDGCFSPYRQGPCATGYHLILKKHKVVPECVQNPCKDGWAKYKGRCYELGKSNGPCPPAEAGGGILGVNTTTLVVECLQGIETLSLINNIPKNLPPCPRGSKRDSANICREKY